MIRASKEEMERAEENPEYSVELSDRSGYLASLGVHHELHCIVSRRPFQLCYVTNAFSVEFGFF
jgi:hypothetical protein